jgi:predicted metal-dependent hydrolase
MTYQRYQIRDSHGDQVTVNLRRDKRLTKTSHWERLPDGSLLLRVPYRLPNRRVAALLEQVATQLDKSITMHRQRNDATLQQRAEMLNKKHFNNKIQWNGICWVSNMQSRLGSCTRGGPTDGQIRISNKIKEWPDWVVDYVIAHELLHRKHPNHSAAFWNELRAAYPLTEQARGFIQGVSFRSGRPVEEDLENPVQPLRADSEIEWRCDGI